MRFREAAWGRMSLNRRAFELLVQLPSIAMLLQVLDGLASHIPSLFVRQAVSKAANDLLGLAQGKRDAVRQMLATCHSCS